MKLVASMIVRNELSRYLRPCIGHLVDFCDEIRILDDGSDDGTKEWLRDQLRAGAPLGLSSLPRSEFFDHEGRRRQQLLDWTLEADPTHVLAIDADEFVEDGKFIRELCASEPDPVWALDMEEVWELDGDCMCVRDDGGWRTHPAPILWKVPENKTHDFAIQNSALACGREPVSIRRTRFMHTGTAILHFGWANESERAARHHRYVEADGGRFHSSRHLDSIVSGYAQLSGREWPAPLAAYRVAIEAAVAQDRA